MRNETAKEIRRIIKEKFGYNSRKVSVRTRSGEINITVKDLSIPVKPIEEEAKKFQSIRRDEITQEILLGGNTYVNVGYDHNLIQEAKDARLEEAKSIIEEHKDLDSNRGMDVKEHGKYKLVYYPNPSQGMPSVDTIEEYEGEHEGKSYTGINNLKSHVAFNEYDIATALVFFDIEHGQ